MNVNSESERKPEWEWHGDGIARIETGKFTELLVPSYVNALEADIKRYREALEKIGRCTRCKGDGSPQCVTCDDYQTCHCTPGSGKYADKCWMCEGTGISNHTAREALAQSRTKGAR